MPKTKPIIRMHSQGTIWTTVLSRYEIYIPNMDDCTVDLLGFYSTQYI